MSYGYNENTGEWSQSAVSVFNQEAMKLGIQGVTILVTFHLRALA